MNKLLEMRGKVMKFDQFITEKMDVDIQKDEVTITPDEDCFKSCWSIIEQQCGGDADTMMKYLTTELGIPFPSKKDLVIYVMELVDDYLNNNITITQGEQYIKHGKRNEFVDALTNIDYKSVVENLLRKLYKVDNDNNIPGYIEDLFKILDDCLIG